MTGSLKIMRYTADVMPAKQFYIIVITDDETTRSIRLPRSCPFRLDACADPRVSMSGEVRSASLRFCKILVTLTAILPSNDLRNSNQQHTHILEARNGFDASPATCKILQQTCSSLFYVQAA